MKQKNSTIKRGIIHFRHLLSLVIVATTVVSCDKAILPNKAEGPLTLNIEVLGEDNEQTTVNFGGAKASSGSRIATVEAIHHEVIPFSEDFNIVAELVPQLESDRTSLKAAGEKRAATVREYSQMANNTRISARVYNADGTVAVGKTDFQMSGSGNGGPDFSVNLPATGGPFTVVLWSEGRTTGSHPTDFTNSNNLNTATYTVANATSPKFMLTKIENVTGSGTQNVKVVLKNRLSEIMVNIDVAALANVIYSPKLTAINTPRMFSSYSTSTSNMAIYQISDESWNTPGTAAAKALSFPSLGSGIPTATVTSATAAVTMVHPETNTAALDFGYLEIGGVKKAVRLENLKITPGVRYNLNLRITPGTCTDQYESFSFDGDGSIPGGWSTTFPAPIPALSPEEYAGTVLDIVKLDNSFNMSINNTPLANKELNFDEHSDSGINVFFTDDTYYGHDYLGPNWIRAIYSQHIDFTYNRNNPLIRVVISKTGEPSIYGSKNGGPLLPMKLAPGTNFNTINWNINEPNEIQVTQLNHDDTYIGGYFTSRKIIPCTD